MIEEASVVPHVNQIEFHPFQQDVQLVKYCRDHQICPQGWSPLAKGKIFGNKEIQSIAIKKGVTEAQVAIRWSLQRGIITIPKSTKLKRVEENLDVFKFQLSAE